MAFHHLHFWVNDMYDINKVSVGTKYMGRVQELLKTLQVFTGIKNGKESQRFNLDKDGKRMCFMLYSGTCIVKRSVDSLVLSTITAPCIVGLHDIYHDKSGVLVTAVSDIQYGMATVEDLFHYADLHNLWKDISYMLMLSTTRFSEYQQETVGISNYELICNLLTSLNNENFEIRATTSALEYIQGRSSLSRSGIMKTLALLRDGGYIVIKKGLLIKINMLPKKF